MLEIPNKLLFFLASLFFVISLLNLFISLQVITSPAEPITGKLTTIGTGRALICIRYFPSFNLSSTYNLTDGTLFNLTINYTNPENNTITIAMNPFLFEINTSNPIINFTPNASTVGNHTAKFYLFETGGRCMDLTLSKNVLFTIFGTSTLQIWDETDAKGGNKTRHAIDRTLFFANYTSSNGSLIQKGDSGCYWRINVTGDYTNFTNMTYNGSYGVFVTNYTTNVNGNFSWQVFCNSTNSYFDIKNATDNVTIFNNPPVKIADYPNQTWNANTVLFGPTLNDYFIDTDGDRLNFTSTVVGNINITIDTLTAVVKFVPAVNFYGNRTVIFTASDGYGGSTPTDPVYLTVLFVQPASSSEGGGTSGGGGGGGGVSTGGVCSENWECGPFGPCLPTGLRQRSCNDLASCDTDYQRPNSSLSCLYHPTCNDSIRNQGESGVDCGGPCGACPTCEDKIQNQGELGLDCGGPCSACPSCYDNVQNQGELGLDCGGPCSPCPSCADRIQNQGELGVDCGGPCSKICPVQEQPAGLNFGTIRLFGILAFLAIIILILSAMGYKYVWPRMVALKKRRISERITLSEVIAQTLAELAVLKKRAGNVPPKEVVDDVSDLMKTFFYHYFSMETPFSFNLMSLMLEQHPQPAKLTRALLAYSKKVEDMQYGAIPKQDDVFLVLKDSELLVNECAKAAKNMIINQNIDVINELVEKAKRQLDAGNARSATKAMARAKKLFDYLPPESQKKLAGGLNSINDRIKALNK